MADKPEMFEPTMGFSGMADSMEPCKMLWDRPLLPWHDGNEIWARRGDPVAYWLVCLSVCHLSYGRISQSVLMKLCTVVWQVGNQPVNRRRPRQDKGKSATSRTIQWGRHGFVADVTGKSAQWNLGLKQCVCVIDVVVSVEIERSKRSRHRQPPPYSSDMEQRGYGMIQNVLYYSSVSRL